MYGCLVDRLMYELLGRWVGECMNEWVDVRWIYGWLLINSGVDG